MSQNRRGDSERSSGELKNVDRCGCQRGTARSTDRKAQHCAALNHIGCKKYFSSLRIYISV